MQPDTKQPDTKYVVFDSERLFFWTADGQPRTSRVDAAGKWTLLELAESGFDLDRKTLLTEQAARKLESTQR